MTMTSDRPTETAVAAPARSLRARRVGSQLLTRYSLLVVWLAMAVAFSVALPGLFATGHVAKAIFGAQQPLVFLGLAVVCTLAVGEFDLSFASIFGLSATLVPSLVVLHHWSYPAAVVVTVVVALLIGLLNAVLIVLVGINSVAVTLGVASAVEGLAYFFSQETSVSGLDPGLAGIAVGTFLGLPLLFWYGLVLVAIAAYVMAATPLGRHMLFVGSNREVARLAGIDVTRVRMGAYLASALICALGGVVVATGLGGFDPGTSATYLMPTFAGVFLGTVAVVPGRFNPFGMFIGVYFLLTGVIGLQLLGLAGWVTNVFYGIALVLAVAVSFLVQRRLRA